jgi:hypothetical protein
MWQEIRERRIEREELKRKEKLRKTKFANEYLVQYGTGSGRILSMPQKRLRGGKR